MVKITVRDSKVSIRVTGIGLGFRKRGLVLVQDLVLFAVTAAL